MTKRIVSGIFILTALGALGVILAGALTSGEQLIVRFLTAVIVAALGLYVISDLRLQADDQASSRRARPGPATFAAFGDLPANSTAAFMATVTAPRLTTSKIGPSDSESQPDRPLTAPVKAEIETDAASGDQEAFANVDEAEGDPTVVIEKVGSLTTDVDHAADNDQATPFSFFANNTRSVTIGSNGVSTNGIADGDLRPTDEQPAIVVQSDDTQHAGVEEAGSGDGGAVSNDSINRNGSQPNDIPLPNEPNDETAGSGDADSDQLDTENSDQENDQLVEALGNETIEASSVHTTANTAGDSTSDEATISSEHAWPVSSAYDPNEASGQTENDNPSTSSTPEIVDVSQIEEPTLVGSDSSDATPAGIVSATSQQIEAADYVDAPLAPIIDLREVHSFQTAGTVDNAIRAGEVEVISTLIEQGMLSTEGEISDRDVRTMVYVAFTSNELRKLLLAGGTPDGPNQGLDLGPVELFDETLHTPAPKTMYKGHTPQLHGSTAPQIASADSEEPQRQLG